LLIAGVLGAGCRSPQQRARLERLEHEKQQMLEQLDELEARLLADQARVRFWKELRARHESVSAIACRNLEGHVAQMDRYQQGQREKRQAHAKKNRLASTFVPGGD
jgi:hypothetical protein